MPLPKLVPAAELVNVQETAFTVDGLARHVCSTWEEATSNGGPGFTAVVVGSGAYGAYLAAKIYAGAPNARVLVLEAGGFLVGEHVQNLGRVGLEVPPDIPPQQAGKDPRALVWGIPWRGNVAFPGLAYCAGGKSLYWGGWCPRLTDPDLSMWPAQTAAYLQSHYTDVESETGVVPGADFIFGDLNDALFPMLVQAAAATPGVETGIGASGVEAAPLAVQGSAPVSGLFSFDKFSSLPLLMDAIRRDAGASGGSDANRRIFLVPRAHVVRLHASNGTVTAVEVDVDGQRKVLPIAPSCNVVLSASTIESTRLALLSFPTPLMGRNLMAHSRSDFTVRIRRTAFPPLPVHVQTAAMLVRGTGPSGRFHLQVTASTSSGGSDDLLFRMVPDIDQLHQHLANTDPDWITVTFRAIGEMHGDKSSQVPKHGGSWVNLSPWEQDEYVVPRAYVQLQTSAEDTATWQAMDETALALAAKLAGQMDRIEYLYDDGWQPTPHPVSRPFPAWHRGLGSTYHEAGTLWMGDDPTASVTDSHGRFHHVSNAYACDQSIFPTVGSVNPVLTGLTLAHQLAGHLR